MSYAVTYAFVPRLSTVYFGANEELFHEQQEFTASAAKRNRVGVETCGSLMANVES
jgi:hypothetical protein